MAALTTASLVGLEDYEPEEDGYYAPTPSRASRWLGLDPTVSTLNASSLLSSSLLSITFLVSINALQPFLLDQLGVSQRKQGTVTGQLLLADEVTALGLYALWGWAVDAGAGVRGVAVAGHAIVAVALWLYPRVGSVWPWLLLARILFACGASALVTTLSAALASFTALPPPSLSTSAEHGSDERTSLLPNGNVVNDSTSHQTRPEDSGRFAGVLGFATGCGALLAVFLFLPLPSYLSTTLDMPIRRGLRWTFTLLAGLAAFESLFLIVGLKRRAVAPVPDGEDEGGEGQEKRSVGMKLLGALRELPRGFVLAWREGEGKVMLAYASSFASRASATIVTAMIPLLVNHYYVQHSLCRSDDDLTSPTNCHSALITSSILTGITQLTSLLLSPLVGYLASHPRISQPALLASTSLLGALSFLAFAFLEDPRSVWAGVCCVGMGVGQIGGIVLGLSLVAQGRAGIIASGKEEGREVAGALGAGYSVCGGIGILLVNPPSGYLFDAWFSGAPFLLVGIVNGVVALVGVVVWRRVRGVGSSRLRRD